MQAHPAAAGASPINRRSMQFATLLLVATSATTSASKLSSANAATTLFEMPATIPQPLAYYYLDEGSGWNLRESISGNSAAGVVTYDTSDTHPENANYTEPNWSEDEFFGSAITCACASYTFYPPPPALSRPLPPHAPRLQPVHSGCDRTQQVRQSWQLAEGHAVARGCGLRPQRQVVDERVVPARRGELPRLLA